MTVADDGQLTYLNAQAAELAYSFLLNGDDPNDAIIILTLALQFVYENSFYCTKEKWPAFVERMKGLMLAQIELTDSPPLFLNPITGKVNGG